MFETFRPWRPHFAEDPEGQDKAYLHFKKHGFKITMPLVVYADYDAVQDAFEINADSDKEDPKDNPSTVKASEMTGTASYAYYAHSEILDIPPELRLVLRRENA